MNPDNNNLATLVDSLLGEHLDIDLSLDPELKNLETLLAFEQEVLASARDLAEARTRFAYNLFMILEHELWRYGGYQTQYEYLKHLGGRCMIGVSTMKAYHSGLRTARELGYSQYSQIAEKGLYVFTEINREVKTDRRTGAPLALPDGNQPPDGRTLVEHLRDLVEEVSINPDKPDVVLSPADIKATIQRRLAPHRANVWLERRNGQLKWYYQRTLTDGTLDFRHGEVEITVSGQPPEEVIETINRMIRAKDIDYG